MSGSDFLIVVAAAFVLQGLFLIALRMHYRRARRRLEPRVDPTTVAAVRQAIEAAGGAEPLIRVTLGEADAAIGRAHRAGGEFGTTSMLLPALVEARKLYARTGDDERDVLRALTLAREADACASRSETINKSFNEWLTENGHRFMS